MPSSGWTQTIQQARLPRWMTSRVAPAQAPRENLHRRLVRLRLPPIEAPRRQRDTERQKRFVIMADENIKRSILAMLKMRGQVYYSGNTAVITVGLVTALEKQR